MSATAKAHGMDGKLVEPDWPPLTLAELRILFAQFPALEEPLEILDRQSTTAFSRGCGAHACGQLSSSSVIIARCAIARACLKSTPFMAHLHNAGASVPRVFASAAGETAIEIGEWTYEVHEIPAGIDLYEDAISWTPFRTAAHAQSAGQALARLHLAAQRI